MEAFHLLPASRDSAMFLDKTTHACRVEVEVETHYSRIADSNALNDYFFMILQGSTDGSN